ncbi:MAG TPA: hypothetical protein VL401_00220 [Alphaproteobacteria bacterium]|jgi:hypothetical protein|nr:hypothetical protein [Alphaproteobacteria bacterium]
MNKNTLIILASTLIVILGLTSYFLYSKEKPVSQKTTDSQAAKLEQQSNSDDTTSIEKDLNDTDLSSVDKESINIEAEIND